MVDSRVYPKLERVPGVQNWVDKVGGLPDYIERIAKHLHYEKGMSISRAIAVAVNTVKRWAHAGKVAKYGSKEHVSAKTVALATKALAEWEAKKASSHLKLSEEFLAFIDNCEVSEEHALFLAEQYLDEEGEVIDLSADTPVGAATSATNAGAAILHPALNTSEGGMDLTALAKRANAIEDPIARSAARQKVLDLAVPPAKLTAAKRRVYAKNGTAMADGSFPVFDRTSLLSACRLARTPAQRRHVMRRARSLGLVSAIPGSWGMSLAEMAMEGLLDLASTIAPRSPGGLATDGRRRYKRQGKWGHGFVPLDQAAKESKAKGSPIAIKRLNRVYAATGRVGNRSAPTKNNPPSVNVDEKSFPGSESAKSLGQILKTPFQGDQNKNHLRKKANAALPTSQLEASKSNRIPNRASQNWDEIPENLKTVRNGMRYVYAEFGGKGFITPWVGGVHTPESTPLDKRKVYRTLSAATAQSLTEAQLRDIVNNPQSSPQAKTVARKYLKKASVDNRTLEASKKP